jgi:hypothetical protein
MIDDNAVKRALNTFFDPFADDVPDEAKMRKVLSDYRDERISAVEATLDEWQALHTEGYAVSLHFFGPGDNDAFERVLDWVESQEWQERPMPMVTGQPHIADVPITKVRAALANPKEF